MNECRNMSCGFRYNRGSSIYGCEHVACPNKYTGQTIIVSDQTLSDEEFEQTVKNKFKY